MGEPDVAKLFAPVALEDTFAGVLAEAAEILGQLRDPLDAELWGSDLLGALASSAAGQASLTATLTGSLVPAAERTATRPALALLRVLAATGSPELRAAADPAAGRLRAAGIEDPPWAGPVGAPRAGECWHYADAGGNSESVTMTFAYEDRPHAVSALLDHGRGGRIKDLWVTREAAALRAETEQAAAADPRVVFGPLGPADAARTLSRAVAAGECPVQPDEVDDVVAHRALLHARLRLLTT